MMTTEEKFKIEYILANNPFGVIATRSTGPSPESAVVGISYTDNMEIIFASISSNRKNDNIKADPHVSFVVGWDAVERKTIQIEGIAILLDKEERARVEEHHCRIHPNHTKMIADPQQEYFRIMPHWLRYSDLAANKPPEVWEV